MIILKKYLQGECMNELFRWSKSTMCGFLMSLSLSSPPSATFLSSSSFFFLNFFLYMSLSFFRASLVAQTAKCLPTMRETWARSLGREDPLEKEMPTHSSILAWKIPWTEDPGSLQSMGSQSPIGSFFKWKWKWSVMPTLCDSPWSSLGQNTEVGSLSLPQVIFPTQGSNPGLPH